MRKAVQEAKFRHYMKKSRKTSISAQERRSCARRAVNLALRLGYITKPEACQVCGYAPPKIRNISYGLHGHHRTHRKPLDVIWLCTSCHYKRDPHPNNGGRDLKLGMKGRDGKFEPKISVEKDDPVIWDMYMVQGISQPQIARIYSVSAACISRHLTAMRKQK